MAALVRLTEKPGQDRNRLLFSNPYNLERGTGKAEPGQNRDRKNVSIQLSYDEGETWTVRKTVEAGVRWSTLQEVLRGDGLTLRTYPSSWFSTVGGWVATGGYGINSLKFGHLSKNVQALQVVTPTGGVEWVEEGHADFPLYFGTEGQLGIVTRVVLRVRLPPKSSEARPVGRRKATRSGRDREAASKPMPSAKQRLRRLRAWFRHSTSSGRS